MSFNRYDAKKNVLISSRVIPCRPETANIKNNKRVFSNYKIKNGQTLKQSPKFKSNLFRPSSCKPRLYSLLDVKYKNVARGTNVPMQYLRVSNKQLSEIMNRKTNAKISYKQKSFITDKKFNTTEVSKSNTNISNMKKSKNIKINIEENNLFNKPAKTERKRHDRWLPKDYENYEKCVKDKKYFKRILNKNNFISCVPTVLPKEIKEKSLESDIFFLGPPSSKEYSKKETIENKNYDIKLKSDIFNRNNDDLTLKKSSEYKLLKEQKNNVIKNSHNLESKSSWAPINNYPTYFNLPSTEYSIISPSSKNFINSREKIKLTRGHNLNLKQKSISEFYNLTKNRVGGAGNFKRSYTENPNCFHKENNICTLFLDMRKQYGAICD